MKLKDWRESRIPKMTQEDLGRELSRVLGKSVETSPVVIWRYEEGMTQASALVAEAIRRLSGGLVTPNDFHETRLAFLRTRGTENQKSTVERIFTEAVGGKKQEVVLLAAE